MTRFFLNYGFSKPDGSIIMDLMTIGFALWITRLVRLPLEMDYLDYSKM